MSKNKVLVFLSLWGWLFVSACPAPSTGGTTALEDGSRGDVPSSVSGTVADRESRGGILGSPSTSEDLIPGDYVARVIGWPGVGLPPWKDAEAFFKDLNAGSIPPDRIQRAQVEHWLPGGVFIIIPEAANPDEILRQFVGRMTPPAEPGFYLLFSKKFGKELDLGVKGFSTLEDLRKTLEDPDTLFVGHRLVGVSLPREVTIPADPKFSPIHDGLVPRM